MDARSAGERDLNWFPDCLLTFGSADVDQRNRWINAIDSLAHSISLVDVATRHWPIFDALHQLDTEGYPRIPRWIRLFKAPF